MLINQGKTLKFERELDVPVEKLFDAWAKPAAFQVWWADFEKVEMDFRVGGKYGLFNEGKAQISGTYREISMNQKIVMTWDSDGCGETPNPVRDSVITLNFSSLGPKKSKLELIHDSFPNEASIG